MAGQIKILCVDNHNDGRSNFTQVYLEILRVWTANTTPSRTWLFKTVSSAALLTLTPFTSTHISHYHAAHLTLSPPTQSRSNTTLHAFNAQQTFSSPEKRQIISRVANRHKRGLHASDFGEYDYIICFDEGTKGVLERLRGGAKRDGEKGTGRASVVVLGFGGGFWESEGGLREAKRCVGKWCEGQLGFRYPERDIGEGGTGVRFVTISEACDQALLRNGSKRLEEIKRKTGCSMRFEKLGDSRDEFWLVSVIGGKNEVDVAARSIEESW